MEQLFQEDLGLPPVSQADSVAVGKNVPVLPVRELVPARESPLTTPDVVSAWFTAAVSVKYRT